MLAGCAFLSRVVKNLMETYHILDEDQNGFQEFVEEKLVKENENKNEMKGESLSYPDSVAHLKPNNVLQSVEMKNK